MFLSFLVIYLIKLIIFRTLALTNLILFLNLIYFYPFRFNYNQHYFQFDLLLIIIIALKVIIMIFLRQYMDDCKFFLNTFIHY